MEDENRRYSRVYATVDLDAVTHNMEAMRANLPEGTGMIGVVKADGYGHGAVPVARTIDGFVEGYAVATADEAILLRRHGIKKPILILGVTQRCRYRELILYDIRPTMFEKEALEAYSALAESMGRRAPVHLAVDTGMSRIGMKPDAASADMVQACSALPGIRIEGMFTHFSTADEADKSRTAVQFKRYLDFARMLKERGVEIPVKHCANSAGIIESIGTELDMVRAGISIYGMYPSDEVEKRMVPLEPALELKSCVSYVKTIQPGDEVSYGGTFRAEHAMRIATIPVGYGDGYPRNLSGKGWVLIHGRKAPILGRICMDQFMVDVTDIDGVKEEDEVTLIGRDGEARILVEDLAEAGGGFHYEIVCNLGKRIPRVYKSGGQVVGTKDYFQDVY
ncbi:MAG: alanine racemase [Lachnospiraceae bacterium]|nr:alanine racemase [Lachnospiraceae bacterium]